MDKKGKTNGIVWVLLIIGAIYLLSSGVFNSSNTTIVKTTTNPTISFTGIDAQQTGTSVQSTYYANVNDGDGGFGAADTPTTAVPDQVISFLLLNATSYHNTKIDDLKIESTTFPYTVKFNKNATITENIYTTTGLVINNGGGAQNQTDLGNGVSYNLKDEMTADSLTSTQDMICVIEMTVGANCSTNPSCVTYGGQQPTSTSNPIWYTLAGTGSKVYLFDQSPISSTSTVTKNIVLTPKSDGRFSALGYMKKSCYTKEYFIDPNSGQIAYDVADSQGTVKSMAIYTYTVYFQ